MKDKVEMIKLLLGDCPPSTNIKVIQYWLNSTEQLIKNYRNIETLPPELDNVLIELTCLRIGNNSKGVGSGNAVATSMSDNGQSVSFGFKANGISTEDQELLSSYKKQLIKFRRLI